MHVAKLKFKHSPAEQDAKSVLHQFLLENCIILPVMV